MANNSSKAYDQLIEKLDAFTRKYYKNQVLRGGLYSIGAVLVFFLTIVSLEYYAQFGTTIRTAIFYAFISINGYVVVKLIAIPVFKLYKLGEIISYEQEARIIGDHFPDVKDKLLNTLQLKIQASEGRDSVSEDDLLLVEASIQQRTRELSPIPFSSAIDLSQNKKNIKFALIPILVFVIMVFAAPSVITESTTRLVNHREAFVAKAPFQFVIRNEKLEGIQQKDFELFLELTGAEIPDQVFIEKGNNRYRLKKDGKTSFSFSFKNLQKSTLFKFSAGGFSSAEYTLEALPNPIVLNFQASLDYPNYLGVENETLQNTGDIIVPEGTKINWLFNTKNTESISMRFSGSEMNVERAMLERRGESSFSHSQLIKTNSSYTIKTANKYLISDDSITYWINVIPDMFPSIEMEEHLDSNSIKRIYFNGLLKDDYGLKNLSFNYQVISEKGRSDGKNISVSVPFTRGVAQSQFFHFWDLSKLSISAGDRVEYYFEVWDNDEINGSKSSRTEKKVFKAPSLSELEQSVEKKNDKIREDIEKSMLLAKKVQRDLKDIQKENIDKKSLSWDEKKKIENVLAEQKELQKNIDQIKHEMSKNFSEQSDYKQVDERLLEKQQQLQDLFEKVMSDEMKELFKEMEEMMNEADKSKLQEMLEKMNLSSKDIEKELDRSLEIFKQLELEQKLNDAINKLDELQEKQEDLAEKSEDKNEKSDELKDKQDELNKEFEELRKDLEEMNKMNEELEFPNDLENTESEEEKISGDMKESSDNLEKGKKSKASDSQESASEEMKKLSNKLQQMQSAMEEGGNEEDLNALRELLENLIQLSFDQERVMDKYKKTNTKSPEYVKLTQDQKKIKDDAKMIEDSLFALSKRVVEIEPYVNREISAINDNMKKTIQLMADRKTPQAGGKQQHIMTAVNNLALLLSEIIEQMQEQMASQMKGDQECEKPGCKKSNCSKPGHGKPSASSMKSLQQQLNKRIKDLKEGKGKSGKNGGKGMSEELAKLAAQQEALRNELQKMNQQLNKDGEGSMGNLEKLAKMMEETETDLVNKRITRETLKRQEEILTRLLEAENAEREREMDKQRRATEAKNENFGNPTEFLEYNMLKKREMELLKTMPASLKPFYKNKVNEYFNNFNN